MTIQNKKQLENFSIKKIKDFGGCPDAAKILFARYKDETDNLLKRKKDIVHLILVDEKPDWALNFLFNITIESHKIKFFERLFNDSVYSSGDKEFSYTCLKCFKAIKTNDLEDIKIYFKELENKSLAYEKMIQNNQTYICQTLFKIIKSLKIDEKREFTRTLTFAFQKLAEIESISSNTPYDLALKNYAINFIDSIKDWIE